MGFHLNSLIQLSKVEELPGALSRVSRPLAVGEPVRPLAVELPQVGRPVEPRDRLLGAVAEDLKELDEIALPVVVHLSAAHVRALFERTLAAPSNTFTRQVCLSSEL